MMLYRVRQRVAEERWPTHRDVEVQDESPVGAQDGNPGELPVGVIKMVEDAQAALLAASTPMDVLKTVTIKRIHKVGANYAQQLGLVPNADVWRALLRSHNRGCPYVADAQSRFDGYCFRRLKSIIVRVGMRWG